MGACSFCLFNVGKFGQPSRPKVEVQELTIAEHFLNYFIGFQLICLTLSELPGLVLSMDCFLEFRPPRIFPNLVQGQTKPVVELHPQPLGDVILRKGTF